MRTDPSLSIPNSDRASTKGRVVAFRHHPRRWPPAVKVHFQSRSIAVLGLIASAIALVFPMSNAAAAGEPPGFEYYHTYAENEQVIDDAVAAHPQIAMKFSIGQSYQGRQIWGIKISDNVSVDENEPEVFIHGLTHARERASNEEALALIEMLTGEYDTNARIKAIVDSREIWIVPMLNPDGAEYDMSGGHWHQWRKNRQPIPGSSEIGVDLNRNWGYHWGGGSATEQTAASTRPATTTAAGHPRLRPRSRTTRHSRRVESSTAGSRSSPASASTAPRTRFCGRTRTRGRICRRICRPMTTPHSWHSASGRSAQRLQAAAGQRPVSRSTATRMTGPTTRIGSLATRSRWPRAPHTATTPARGAQHGHSRQPRRRADVPGIRRLPISRGGARPGLRPAYDDFETVRGWQVNPNGTDTATSGMWQVADPAKTRNAAGIKQRGTTVSGMADLVTGAAAGSGAGRMMSTAASPRVRSPSFTLGANSSTGWTARLQLHLRAQRQMSSADYLKVSVGGDVLFAQTGSAANRNAVWTPVSIDLDAYAGQSVRVVIQAADGGADSLVEAAVDDVRVYQQP